MSLGTIYRNLDRLQREGTIAEIYCGDFVRYDADASTHDHFLCRACRRAWDFDQGSPKLPASSGPFEHRFRIDGHYTVFYGLCGDCQVRESSDDGSWTQ